MFDRMMLTHKRRKFFLIVIFLSLFFTTTFSQTDLVKPKIAHKVFFGFLGYGYNKFFNGLAPNVGYEFHFNKNYVSATYHGFQEFTIFRDDDPQEVTEASLLFNRQLIIKPVIVSAGAGVAYNSVTADIKNIVQSSYGDYYTPAQVTKLMLGLTLNLNISIPTKRRVSTGLNFHSNFNSFANFYSVDIFLSYRF